MFCNALMPKIIKRTPQDIGVRYSLIVNCKCRF